MSDNNDIPTVIYREPITILVIRSLYNQKYTAGLLTSTQETLTELCPEANVEVVEVPGANEIPVTVEHFMQRKEYAVVICLGLIVQGKTQHAQMIGTSIAQSLQQLSIQQCRPIVNEVLLVDNEQQADERCLPTGRLNRGIEAAQVAAFMANLLQLK